jgi:hypothetical protein
MVDHQISWVIRTTWIRSGKRYCWLQARTVAEKWSQKRHSFAANHSPRTRNWDQMHRYIKSPLERIAIIVTRSSPLWATEQTWLLLTNLPSGQKPAPFSTRRQKRWLSTFFFCHGGVPVELDSDRGLNHGSYLIQESLQCAKEQDPHHTPAPGIWQHGHLLLKNGQGAPTNGHCIIS